MIAQNDGQPTLKTRLCIGCASPATHKTRVEYGNHGKLTTVGVCDSFACGLEINFTVFDLDRINAYKA